MNELELRPYQRGDEASINYGFNEVFGLQRPLEDWVWKFRPDEQGSYILVAADHGHVVAHFAVLRVPVQVDGRRRIGGHVVDAYCRRLPGVRQQRVYVKTVLEFYRRYGVPEHLSFIFGFPGERHLQLGRLRFRYALPQLVPVWRRPARTHRLFWPRYDVRLGENDAALDALWARAQTRYAVTAIRDGAWSRRRYHGRAGNPYVHLTVWRRKTVHAWAVLQTGDTGRWIDLLWDGEDPRALVELDEAVAHTTAAAGAKNLELWLGGDAAAAAVLARRGWEQGCHPERLHMTTSSYDDALDGDDLVRRFYVTMGDSDLV